MAQAHAASAGNLVLGYRGLPITGGMPGPWFGASRAADPLLTLVKTTTLMFNGFYDLARFDPLTPYLGAGVGLAYNQTGGVSFTGNPV